MASERRTLRRDQGVTLEEVCLRNNGAVVDRGYVVKTLRSPQTWSFGTEAEAIAQFEDEVKTCRDDPFVQGRLRRKRPKRRLRLG
jgi:hypothetical protein